MEHKKTMDVPVPVQKLTYSISSVATPQAIEQWRHNLSEVVDTRVSGEDQACFQARLSIGAADHALFMETQSCPQIMARTQNLIRANEFDLISMTVVRSGEHHMDANGRCTVLSPGDVFFTHHARPSTVAYTSFDCLRLHIPRTMAPSILRDADINGLVLKGTAASTGLLTRHIEGLWASLVDLTASEISTSVEAAFLIAAGNLRANPTFELEHREAINRTLLSSIQSYIQDRLFDPNLGPEAICAAFRISRSALYRLFEHEGGVVACITARRLDRCWQKLKSQGREAGLISSLAYDHGFNSDVSFSRAFRRRFGVTPGDVRGSVASAPHRSPGDEAMRSIEQRILSKYRNLGSVRR